MAENNILEKLDVSKPDLKRFQHSSPILTSLQTSPDTLNSQRNTKTLET